MSERTVVVLSVLVLFSLAGCPGAGPPAAVPADAAETTSFDMGAPGGDTVGGNPDVIFRGCQPYIAALTKCSFQWLLSAGACPRAPCLPGPCAVDDDCPVLAEPGAGDLCVLGSCVGCWQDADCDGAGGCRAGRCIARTDPLCPAAPACDALGCGLVSISEVPCPVCLCDPPFHRPCSVDAECQVLSSHPYSRCVYGRCAECRNDDDCGGVPCLPPGVCRAATPHPEALYGTWLIGWPGGLNHYSLFRFEPDGTLRRARLPEDPAWADDIPPFPCDPAAVDQWPVLGTWEPAGEGGALSIRMTSGVPCDGEAWSAEYRVLLGEDGDTASFLDTDGGQALDAMRVPTDICDPSFASCSIPETW